MTTTSQPDYLIIGSGISALSVAALLAKAGHRITLLEAHNTAGGYAHTFEVDHFQFCAQVHYIWGCAPGQTVYEFLKKLDLHQEVTFKALNPNGYDVAVLPDGKRVRIPFGFDKLTDQLDAAYPGQRSNIKKFLDIIARLKYEISRAPNHVYWWHYITRSISSRYLIHYRNHTLQQLFDECQLSKEIQAILCCQAGDLGAPPAVLSILAYTALFGGYNEGAYYPTQHFTYFIGRLTELITHSPGCDIIYNSKVVKIHSDHQRVTSVTTADGKTYSADRVICNMDPQQAAHLMGIDKFSSSYQRALSYEYSPSSFILYIGLEGIDLRQYGFTNANIWHLTQWDMNTMWREQLSGNFNNPWYFISSPYLRTPDLSSTPPQCQNLEVGTLCSYETFAELYQNDKSAYHVFKDNLANQFIDFVEHHHVPSLRRHIRSLTVGTPITNQSFCGAPRGNCYGSNLTPFNMGLSRLTAETPWNNFYWCNASSGYPGVNGTVLTGINLYTDLTGDDFMPSGNQLPSPNDNIRYAKNLLY